MVGRRARAELDWLSGGVSSVPKKHLLEFISDRLIKVTLELCDRARSVPFVVAYAPTKTQIASKKHSFWTALDRVVKEVPGHQQLFVLKVCDTRFLGVLKNVFTSVRP